MRKRQDVKNPAAVPGNQTRLDEAVKDSICYMCGSGCPTEIRVSHGKAVGVENNDPRLKICPRWRAQLDFVYHPERLQYPLKRTGARGSGPMVRVSWDEALDTIASKLRLAADEYGPESVVFYVTSTKESLPYYHRLTHAFGSPNFCTGTSNCFTAAWLAAVVTYGKDFGYFVEPEDTFSNPLTRCKMIWGSGVMHSTPKFWKEFLATRPGGLKLIVIDPRRTRIASMADIHLQLRPGTDGALALGLINIIIAEQLYDREFVGKWMSGFDDLKELIRAYPPERVESITGVPAARIREAAILYATQKPANIIVSPVATTHCSNGVQNHRAIILLPALTGNLDIQGGNPGRAAPVPMNKITLHERITNLPPGLGSERFPIWTKLREEMQANTLARRIEERLPYPIKALFGAGINITFFPNSSRLLKNLGALDFIAVADYFPNAVTQLADIVLPVASWLERENLINKPGKRIRLVGPAIEPVGESWLEWKIVFELARRLGLEKEFWYGDFEKSLDYMLEPSGITLKDLRRHPEGIENYETPRPDKYYERAGFQTPSGKVEIASSVLGEYGYESLPVYKEPFESPLSRPDLAESFPLVLTSGARTIAFTHSQHRNIPRLRKIMPEPYVQINPCDAYPRGIGSGDKVMVSSPRGTIKLKAEVTDIILPGAVHIPHHWAGECNVNILTDDEGLDPISGFAPFKSQLCQVARL
jgi:anaerobic selenocysteine-containing dehydrogenase